MARRQIRVEQKLEYISDWKRSGLSKTGFCKKHKIAFSGFHIHKQFRIAENILDFLQT